MPEEGFGLAFVRTEGAPIHPDDPVWDTSYEMTKEFYDRQLKAYNDYYKKERESKK